MADLIGIGLASMKFTVRNGISVAWMRRAAAKSFASASSTIFAISAGMPFDAPR